MMGNDDEDDEVGDNMTTSKEAVRFLSIFSSFFFLFFLLLGFHTMLEFWSNQKFFKI